MLAAWRMWIARRQCVSLWYCRSATAASISTIESRPKSQSISPPLSLVIKREGTLNYRTVKQIFGAHDEDMFQPPHDKLPHKVGVVKVTWLNFKIWYPLCSFWTDEAVQSKFCLRTEYFVFFDHGWKKLPLKRRGLYHVTYLEILGP